MPHRIRFWLACSSLFPALVAAGSAQTSSGARMPPDYRGVSTHVSGIFVTPVPGAPFSATVNIVSKQVLPDGSDNTRTTIAHVARDGSGRIYNEMRAMEPVPLQGEPPLLSSHIYDPLTHLNTFLNPSTHLAHQSVYTPPATTPGAPPNLGRHDGGQLTAETPLGEQTMGGVRLEGTRKTWTVPAAASGTGQALTVTDEYWYAPALSVYLILKHEDPRTGEQIVAVEDVKAEEPDPSTFGIPARFRVVDETPAP